MAFINDGARASLATLASATSANGAARNGTAQPTNLMQPGSLLMECSATIVTGSVVATFKVQGSNDAATWFDLKGYANAAYTALAATGTVALEVPQAAQAYRYVRAVATLSGAATAGGDLTQVTTRWLRFGELE